MFSLKACFPISVFPFFAYSHANTHTHAHIHMHTHTHTHTHTLRLDGELNTWLYYLDEYTGEWDAVPRVEEDPEN